jgi:hypothetical protein
VRRLLVLALALLIGLPSSSSAATRPLVTDARGDARALGAGFDIVGADVRVVTSKKPVPGRQPYLRKDLVATVTFAGRPEPRHMSLQLAVRSSTCRGPGSYMWRWAGDGGVALPLASPNQLTTSRCSARGSSRYFDVESGIKGNSLVWTISLRELGEDLPVGTVLDEFRVYAHLTAPVAGTEMTAEDHVLVNQGLNHRGPNTAIDQATSSARYVIR